MTLCHLFHKIDKMLNTFWFRSLFVFLFVLYCNFVQRDVSRRHCRTKWLEQERVAELKLYEGLIVNIPSILFAMFAGSWADQRGRKVILALPFLGNTAHLLLLISSPIFLTNLHRISPDTKRIRGSREHGEGLPS